MPLCNRAGSSGFKLTKTEIATVTADAAIVKGEFVKLSTGSEDHVIPCNFETDTIYGVASKSAAINEQLEVYRPADSRLRRYEVNISSLKEEVLGDLLSKKYYDSLVISSEGIKTYGEHSGSANPNDYIHEFVILGTGMQQKSSYVSSYAGGTTAKGYKITYDDLTKLSKTYKDRYSGSDRQNGDYELVVETNVVQQVTYYILKVYYYSDHELS